MPPDARSTSIKATADSTSVVALPPNVSYGEAMWRFKVSDNKKRTVFKESKRIDTSMLDERRLLWRLLQEKTFETIFSNSSWVLWKLRFFLLNEKALV